MGTAEVDALQCGGLNGLTALELLPPATYAALREVFTRRQVEYVAHVLHADEIAVIGNLADALVIARIKRMRPARLKRYDNFVPTDARQQQFYQSLQVQWLRDEEYLLGTRLGRRPTHEEFFIDFMKNRNGLRFRAYFAIKYPERMRRVGHWNENGNGNGNGQCAGTGEGHSGCSTKEV